MQTQLDRLAEMMALLLEAQRAQVAAIDKLAESNRELVDLLISRDAEDDPDAQPATFMDGTPVR